jgi:hypothetical protein
MWEPRCLTALWAFTACYRNSFTFTCRYQIKRRHLVQTNDTFFKISGLSLGNCFVNGFLRQQTRMQQSRYYCTITVETVFSVCSCRNIIRIISRVLGIEGIEREFSCGIFTEQEGPESEKLKNLHS